MSAAATRAMRRRPRWRYVALLALGLGCSRPGNRDVEVEINRVGLDPDSGAPVVLLVDKAHTVALPISIGPAEAQAIASRLAGIDPPRPLTHDLMKAIMDRVGVGLQRVVIRELRDNTYYASLVLQWRGEEIEIDSRPSDAIAMALRFGQPIFVKRTLLEGQGAVELRGAAAEPRHRGGISVQALSDDLAAYFKVAAGHGVVVSDVASGGPLRRGDVILAVDGHPVRGPDDFRAKLHGGNGPVDLDVQRDGVRVHVAFDGRAHVGVD